MDMGIGCQGTQQRDKVAMQGHVWDHIKDTCKSQCTYKMKDKADWKHFHLEFWCSSLLIVFWNLRLTLTEQTGEGASLQQQEKQMFVIVNLRTHHK